METVIYNKKQQRVPIKMWLPEEEMEEGALEQALNLSKLPFAYKHIAIMPDSHRGYGMPIGGVLATNKVVVPNAVGVDIGCGMCALKTDIKDLEKDQLKEIMGIIRGSVPVGFKHHEEDQPLEFMPPLPDEEDTPIVCKEFKSAIRQIGTLGGGNHFIEIQKDEEGYIWIMIHSGSRNLGKTVADHYHAKAQELNKRWYSELPNDDLAFLPIDSEQGKKYIKEMEYCVEFAYANRKLMMERIKGAFNDVVGEFNEDEFINIAHNYAAMENHFDNNVMVHRKGATLAREGTDGIIPGSQGANSYIVKGKGNPHSFHSCSHGAGRVMSRTEAKKTLDLEKTKKDLEDKGVVHAVRHDDDLDEAPQAYKDITKVMERQSDLVEIRYKLTPLGVVKG